MGFGDMFKKKLGDAAALAEKALEKAAKPAPAAEEAPEVEDEPADEDLEAAAEGDEVDDDSDDGEGDADEVDAAADDDDDDDGDDDDGDDDDGDDDDDDARPNETERERRIRKAIEGPTSHVFSDQDNTEQGQKAIALGIKNRREGRSKYDYTKAKGADFKWPDLDPDSLGTLEPWLCYGIEEDSGWVDLNFIADGALRRATAAYKQTGALMTEPFNRVDAPAFAQIEKLLDLDDAALAKATAKLGVKVAARYSPRDYFTGMRADYEKIRTKSMGRAQAAIDVAMDMQKESLRAAAAGKPGLLDPVDGISLEVYATVQVKRSKLPSPDAWPKLLAEYGMDEAKWAKVDGVFMARMSDPSDPMATAAFATEYGKFYGQASSGQFAAGAKAGAKAGGLDGSHRDIKAAKEPVSFERYVEIMTAQECWSTAGKDVNAMLKKVFQMDASDWSNLGAYWSQKMVSDINMVMKLPDLQAKYRPRYQQASADDDLEV